MEQRYTTLANHVLHLRVRPTQARQNPEHVGQRVAVDERLPQLEVTVEVGGDVRRLAQQVLDRLEADAALVHHVAQPHAHLAYLDAVDDDAEALEVQDVLVGRLCLRAGGVEVVEVGEVGAEVGDERVHLLLVAEADVGDELHEGLEQLRVAAHKRALDVVEQELELLCVAAQGRELVVDVRWLFARLETKVRLLKCFLSFFFIRNVC